MAALLVVTTNCGNSSTPKDVDTKAKQPLKNTEKTLLPQEGSIKVKIYPDAKGAIADIILQTNPAVVGFGEFHQHNGTVKIQSALDRFRTQLLPMLAPATSDVVVETWVPKGCGKVEQKVIKEVVEVTERPKETENETIRLINDAKVLGVKPHILDVKCEQYDALFDTDGQMDFLAMLTLVGQMLGDTSAKVLDYRTANPLGTRQRMLIYGGAIHNDLYASDEWKSCTFGPGLKKRVNKYIAIDLFVPEFIENNDLLKEENWYPLFKKNASHKMVVVFEKAPDSFVLIFKRGVVSPNNASTAANQSS